MRILVVTQYFWPENFKINDFVSGMTSLGHEITVFTGKPNYPAGKFYDGYNFFNKKIENYNGVRVIRSPLVPRGKGSGLRLLLNYLSFAFFASFTGLLRINERFDLIFVYEPSPITVGIPALFLKKKLRVPLFFWVLDLWPDSVEIAGKIKNQFVLKLLNKLVINIYNHSDKIFISSRAFFEPIREKNVPADKIVYFPNWPEENYFLPVNNILKYSSLIPFGFKIMFAGNIGDSQDFESIVSAAYILRNNKNIHWIILGDGRKRMWLDEQVDNFGLKSNFHLFGSFPSEEMPYFFSHCDALLVTLRDSKIFSLTVPAKIQSYLAFGKPVLAMLNGEGSAIIEEAQAGLTCKAGDYKQLAKNIEILYNMEKSSLLKMGLNGKEYSNLNFNRISLFRKFEKVYTDL